MLSLFCAVPMIFFVRKFWPRPAQTLYWGGGCQPAAFFQPGGNLALLTTHFLTLDSFNPLRQFVWLSGFVASVQLCPSQFRYNPRHTHTCLQGIPQDTLGCSWGQVFPSSWEASYFPLCLSFPICSLFLINFFPVRRTCVAPATPRPPPRGQAASPGLPPRPAQAPQTQVYFVGFRTINFFLFRNIPSKE